eukprot:5541737-Heterocapsa_arctica.AAC.1
MLVLLTDIPSSQLPGSDALPSSWRPFPDMLLVAESLSLPLCDLPPRSGSPFPDLPLPPRPR